MVIKATSFNTILIDLIQEKAIDKKPTLLQIILAWLVSYCSMQELQKLHVKLPKVLIANYMPALTYLLEVQARMKLPKFIHIQTLEFMFF